MGHVNRHRTHGDAPKLHRNHDIEKKKVESDKRRKKRRKLAKTRDRRRAERITQEFGYNTYHTCTSKVYYPSKRRVSEAMVRVEAVFGVKCYGYHCPLCGGWHITTTGGGTRNEMFGIDELRGANATV